MAVGWTTFVSSRSTIPIITFGSKPARCVRWSAAGYRIRCEWAHERESPRISAGRGQRISRCISKHRLLQKGANQPWRAAEP
jgi:hypothetical protein